MPIKHPSRVRAGEINLGLLDLKLGFHVKDKITATLEKGLVREMSKRRNQSQEFKEQELKNKNKTVMAG